FGPNNSTIIVKCLTDNINRTISYVRPAFTKSKSKLGAEGSVAYLYDVEATVIFSGMNEEEALDALIMAEVDAKDIITLEDGRIKITGEPTDFYKIKTAIETAKPDIAFDIDEITTTPQEYVELNDEEMELFERLMGLLDDCDDVDQVFHNVSNYDDGEEE
ncbi:MAG: YebC/PmpR family DNA-binding transcriptional regulator, partial [Coprobacillus sp.]